MPSFKRRTKPSPDVSRCATCGTRSIVQIVDLAANSKSGFCRNCGDRWETQHRTHAEDGMVTTTH